MLARLSMQGRACAPHWEPQSNQAERASWRQPLCQDAVKGFDGLSFLSSFNTRVGRPTSLSRRCAAKLAIFLPGKPLRQLRSSDTQVLVSASSSEEPC